MLTGHWHDNTLWKLNFRTSANGDGGEEMLLTPKDRVRDLIQRFRS